jgi:hypothetical protein
VGCSKAFATRLPTTLCFQLVRKCPALLLRNCFVQLPQPVNPPLSMRLHRILLQTIQTGVEYLQAPHALVSHLLKGLRELLYGKVSFRFHREQPHLSRPCHSTGECRLRGNGRGRFGGISDLIEKDLFDRDGSGEFEEVVGQCRRWERTFPRRFRWISPLLATEIGDVRSAESSLTTDGGLRSLTVD